MGKIRKTAYSDTKECWHHTQKLNHNVSQIQMEMLTLKPLEENMQIKLRDFDSTKCNTKK